MELVERQVHGRGDGSEMPVIPSMGGTEIGPALEKYASEVPDGLPMVEVGCWLGAGTVHLAKSGKPVHVYDRFRANSSEVAKAAAFGVALEVGQDTLPLVKERVSNENVHFHKVDIRRARWKGPIGLYVDDASKAPRMWKRSSMVFLSRVVVGGVAVLMDFHFDKHGPLAQVAYMESRTDEWRLIEDRVAGTSCAIFRRI